MNKAHVAIFLIALFLTGCTGVRLIDSQVSSFAPKQIAVGASYRFDRLPSQQADATAQNQLEAMTERALAKVGLKHNENAPAYSPQVTAKQRMENNVVDGPGFGWNLGWRVGGGHVMLGNRHGPLFPGLGDQLNYWREVTLVLREQATQAVVFESRASHDGPWSDSQAVFPAMLDAALQGFPNPPPGPRQVGVEIPR